MIRLTVNEIVEAVGGRLVGEGEAAFANINRVINDSRQAGAEDLFVAIPGDRFDGHDYVDVARHAGASAALVSRPLPLDPQVGGTFAQILVRDTVAALGRLATWYRRRLPATVIAITGSNGKTTTKAMVEHILRDSHDVVAAPRSYNNNIGLPLTLLSADASTQAIVCEVGTNAPGEIATLGRIAAPDVAVVVSIAEAHLEKLRSIQGVAAEKASLLGALEPGGIGIINGDRPYLAASAAGYDCKIIRFGTDPTCDLVIGPVQGSRDGIRFTLNDADAVELPMPGVHNAVNATAAIAVARRMGLTVAQAAARLADFVAPPMRMQRVDVGGVHVINDAYNANPASMSAALDVFAQVPVRDGAKVFVCGDMLELGDESESFHYQLGQRVALAGVSRLVAVGGFAGAVAQGATQGGMALEAVLTFPATETMLKRVGDFIRPGDLVLIKGSRGNALERVVEALEKSARPKKKASGNRKKK